MDLHDEDLLSVVYSSDACEPFSPERLESLLELSHANNAERHITGMLLYRRGRFIQYLEGPEPARRHQELEGPRARHRAHRRAHHPPIRLTIRRES